jgi:hypothetical protein
MLGEDWCSRQLRKALIEEYPYLQPRKMTTGEIHPDYDYLFIVGEYDIPGGWLQLFLQCCEDIKEPLIKADYLDKFRFTQVKEKYGSLRLYSYGATNEVKDILDKYEFLSRQVCCVCGKPATTQTYDWICPYCFEHIKDSGEKLEDCKVIDIETSYTRRTWSADGYTETIVNCRDEWERYLNRIGYTDD